MARIINLEDKTGEKVYPKTKANAVYMDNSTVTVQEEVEALTEEGYTFNVGATMSKTLPNGWTEHYTFDTDRVVVQTLDEDGETVKTDTVIANGTEIKSTVVRR